MCVCYTVCSIMIVSKVFHYNQASSHMFKHFMDKHRQEQRPAFKMVAVKFFRSAFIRQLSEAVRLRRRTQQPNTTIMNSRGEYSRSRLPRLIVEDPNDLDNSPENVRKDNETRVAPSEVKFNLKSDDNSKGENDKRKVKRNRQSADSKITKHFKPVT